MTGPYRLLAAQIICHLSIIPMVLYGQWWHYIVALFIYFLTGCFGMSMTYHRLLSHRSWKAPKWFAPVGSFLGTIGLVGSTISWTAIHRQHHQYADTKKDPHSPHSHSSFFAHFLSMFSPPSLKYAKDLVQSPMHRFFHRNYWLVNGSFAGILFVIDPFSVVYAYLFPAMILWNGGSAVNTICHLYGYKNHETKDKSLNNWVIGYFTWGEGWHNNHHSRPSRAIFQEKSFEFDMGGFFIKRLGSKSA